MQKLVVALCIMASSALRALPTRTRAVARRAAARAVTMDAKTVVVTGPRRGAAEARAF